MKGRNSIRSVADCWLDGSYVMAAAIKLAMLRLRGYILSSSKKGSLRWPQSSAGQGPEGPHSLRPQ